MINMRAGASETDLPKKIISYVESTWGNKKFEPNRMKIELSGAELSRLEEAKQESWFSRACATKKKIFERGIG